MKINYSVGKVGIVAVLLTALAGCTTYVVQQPDAQPAYVPPPDPAPVVVQPAPEPVYVQSAPPAVVVIQSDDDFYQPLSPYGEWVVVGSYGRVWRPAHVEAAWRPYSNGHWELTDDGWYWASDEPWAWATYHYGRWELAAGYGWIWVPETQWAPAWVSWRSGGGYVGWAPLPPERRGGVTVNVTIAPAAYCFVPEGRMHDPVRPTTVIVNNTTVINKTVNITKTKVVNKVVINEGPRADEVERVSGRKIQKVSVSDLRHKDEEPVAEKHGNLRAGKDRDQQPAPKQLAPKQPEPRKDDRPQDLGNRGPQPKPVVQPPVRKEPVGPEPKPVTPAKTFQPKQPVAPPARNAKPVENKNNREQAVREQTPPPAPPPREVRSVEKPAEPTPPAVKNPAQPNRPQPQLQPKRPVAKSPKQQKESEPKNAKPAKQANGKDRKADTDADGGRK